MRRLVGLVLVVVSLVPTLIAAAGMETVRDDFKEVSYGGSDGSLPWAAPWQEISESDGPDSGQIRVGDTGCSDNRCLQMNGGLLGSLEIRRRADLGEFSSATLSLDLKIEAALLSTGSLRIDARGNGSGWKTLASYSLLKSPQSSPSFDLGEQVGKDFEIRFVLAGLLGGDRVRIDRVVVEVSGAPVTTSSTSTTAIVDRTTSTAHLAPTSTTSDSTTTTQSRVGSQGASPPSSTTTTAPTSTSTTEGERTALVTVDEPSPPPTDGGATVIGPAMMSDYRPGTVGRDDVEVLAAELEADYSLAVEALDAAKLWIAILALLVTAAIVSGMDSRQMKGESG